MSRLTFKCPPPSQQPLPPLICVPGFGVLFGDAARHDMPVKTKRRIWAKVKGKSLANDWSRPIIVALSWLRNKRLLTTTGRQMMRSPFHRMALTSACVTQTGRRFLDAHWAKWYSERGVFLVFMGYGNAKEDYDNLDALYAQWKSKQPVTPPKPRAARSRPTRMHRRKRVGK